MITVKCSGTGKWGGKRMEKDSNTHGHANRTIYEGVSTLVGTHIQDCVPRPTINIQIIRGTFMII